MRLLDSTYIRLIESNRCNGNNIANNKSILKITFVFLAFNDQVLYKLFEFEPLHLFLFHFQEYLLIPEIH